MNLQFDIFALQLQVDLQTELQILEKFCVGQFRRFGVFCLFAWILFR